jgi:hypothetical protein
MPLPSGEEDACLGFPCFLLGRDDESDSRLGAGPGKESVGRRVGRLGRSPTLRLGHRDGVCPGWGGSNTDWDHSNFGFG